MRAMPINRPDRRRQRR